MANGTSSQWPDPNGALTPDELAGNLAYEYLKDPLYGAQQNPVNSWFWYYFPWPPTEMTVYVRFVEDGSANSLTVKPIWQISHSNNAAPRLMMWAWDGYQANHEPSGVGIVHRGAPAAPVGSMVELSLQLSAEGALHLHRSINGGPVQSSGWSAAVPLNTHWSDSRLWVGGVSTAGLPLSQYRPGADGRYVTVRRGVRTMEEMREAYGILQVRRVLVSRWNVHALATVGRSASASWHVTGAPGIAGRTLPSEWNVEAKAAVGRSLGSAWNVATPGAPRLARISWTELHAGGPWQTATVGRTAAVRWHIRDRVPVDAAGEWDVFADAGDRRARVSWAEVQTGLPITERTARVSWAETTAALV